MGLLKDVDRIYSKKKSKDLFKHQKRGSTIGSIFKKGKKVKKDIF